MKINWNFHRGGGVLEKIFHGGIMDIFWNYTLLTGFFMCLIADKRQTCVLVALIVIMIVVIILFVAL